MAVGLKPANASPDSTCTSCAKSQKALQSPLKRCAACRHTLYCSEKCQKADRTRHIPECQALKAAAAEEAGRAAAAKNEKVAAKKAEKAAARKEEEEVLAAHRQIPEIPRSNPLNASSGSPSAHQLKFGDLRPHLRNPLYDHFSDIPVSVFAEYMRINEEEMHYTHKVIKDMMADADTGDALPSTMALGRLLPSFPHRTYFESLSDTQVAWQLIDSYRLRIQDTYIFRMDQVGLYGGEDPVPHFEAYLDLAEKREVVPSDWTPARRRQVLSLAKDEHGGRYLGHAVKKPDLIEKYGGHEVMPFILREVASKVYGTRIIDGLTTVDVGITP